MIGWSIPTRSLLSIVLTAVMTAAATDSIAATGPPDARGWAWADSDEPGVDLVPETPITGYTLIASPLPDEAVYAVPLSFPFTLYGQTSTTVWLSSNGWLSLSDPFGAAVFTNSDLPDPATPNATLAYFWDDLTDVGGSFAQHAPTANGHQIIVRHFLKATGLLFQAYIQFYNTGAVKVVYLTGTDLSSATIGIENETGGVGNRVAFNGTTSGGANVRDNYAILFYPAQIPNCPGATSLTCPALVNGNTTTGQSDVSRYNCAAGTYSGRESVYSFSLASLSRVDLAITGLGARDQDLHLVRSTCEATFGCVSGGADTVNRSLLPPGNYYAVVDGRTPLDDGTHSLSFNCAPVGTPITCGANLNGSAIGASAIDDYTCFPGDHAGPEQIYTFTLTTPQTIIASLTPATPFNLVLVDLATLQPVSTSCLRGNDSAVAVLNLAAGSYALIVDGPTGSSGNFNLSLDCSNGVPTIPIACGAINAPGSNVRPSMIDSYDCWPAPFTYGEEFYRLQTATRSAVTATLFNGATHDVFAFREATMPIGCIARGDTTVRLANLAADDYVFAVDSESTAGGVALSVACNPMATSDILCGETLPGITAATSAIDRYSCLSGNHLGGEAWFVFNNPVTQVFAVGVTPADPTTDLDITIIQGPVDAVGAACVAGGDRVARVTNAPPGEYVIVVDGAPATNGSALVVTATCGASALSCPSPINLSCNSLVSGDTTIGTQTAAIYSRPDELFTGGEIVYRFTNPGPGNLAMNLLLQNTDPRIDLLLLTSCDPTSAVAYGDDAIIQPSLAPGTYFVVVDGRDGYSGPFELVTFCGGPTLEPAVLRTTLSPGQCYSETKRLYFPPTIPNADVMFSFDLSGSMGQELNQMKTNAQNIYTALNTIIPSLRFGLASFVEYATPYADTVCGVSHTPSAPTPFHFRLDQPLTGNITQVNTVLQTINLVGGAKETYTRTFFEAYANPNIGWRTCARKLWLSFGDEPAVDCNFQACIGGNQNTGRDPGPDLLTGTLDDLLLLPTVDQMAANNIVLIPVDSSEDPTLISTWDCLARRTGGQVFTTDQNGMLPGGSSIVDGLVGVIIESLRGCPEVRLTPTGPYASWVTITPASYTGIRTPFYGEFTITFCIPPGTPSGTYPIAIDASCLGAGSCVNELLGTQDVLLDVVECPVTPVAETNTPAPVCAGGSAILDGSASIACSAAGLQYRWLDGITVVCPWSSTPTCAVVPPGPGPTTYTLEISCTDSPTCVASTTATVDVVPYPLPVLAPLPAICEGMLLDLDAAASDPQACPVPLEYQFSSGATILQAWSTAPRFGPVSPAISTTYTVEVRCTVAPGCAASTSESMVVIPDPIADAGPDRSLCEGLPVTLSAAASTDRGCPGGLLYEWRLGATVVRPFSPIPTWTPPTATPGTFTYTVVVRCAGTPSCESEDPVDVDVRACPLSVHFDRVDATWDASGTRPTVNLAWLTVAEDGTVAFTVERANSKDGNFEAIGEVVGAHGSGQPYELNDPTATSGSSPWYRIVEWTFDGRGDVSLAVRATTPKPPLGGGRERSGVGRR